MKVLFEIATIEEVRIAVKPTSGMKPPPMSEYFSKDVSSRDGEKKGTVKELVYGKWNEGEFPREEGQHDNLVFVENPVGLDFGGSAIECDLFATLTVGRERYLVDLSEAQMAMLQGEGPEVEMPDPELDGVAVGAGEAVEAEFTIELVRPYA